jgi:hypothetical protein
MSLWGHLARQKKRAVRPAARAPRSAICAKCSKPSAVGRFCRPHWFSNAALNTTGKWADGPRLEALLLQQGNRCAYSGLLLVLGENASLDHKDPLSRGGTPLVENIQWVDYQVNRMKNDMTHDEFIAMCRLVLSHQK